MAASDKNIVISPQRGSATLSPSLVFTGGGADPISIYALDGVPGSLSFEGSAGQLFSITNNLTSGSIFSVNDVSGIPSIDVDASGLVQIAPLGGTVAIGQSTVTAGQTVDIKGNLRVDGTLTITSTANIANLNADSLDGLDSSQFLRSDISDTFSGQLTLANSNAQFILDHSTQSDPRWAFYSWTSGLNIYPIDSASTIYLGRDGQVTSVDLYNFSALSVAGTQILNSSRQLSNVTFGGNTIWHAGNDGSGSGLDADLLDGVQGASFLRSDADDSFTGSIVTTSTNGIRFGNTNQTDTNDGFIAAGRFASGLNIVGTQTTAGTGRQVRIWGSVITDGGATYWHSSNDGSGSGLDADLLDGLNATSGNTGSTIVSRDGSGNFSAGTITASLSGTASASTIVTGTSGQLVRKDDRVIEPNSITAGRLQFGFTSWTNNDSAPYADYLHLRSYTDSSGGSDNLITFLKSGIGMRIWQQTFNSSTAYASYVDVWTSGNDGAGSGLDADLLDGQQGSYYQPASNALTTSTTFGGDVSGTYNAIVVANDSHTHDGRYYTEAESDARFLGISAKAADSNLLDGIDSGSFLRSDANDSASGVIDFLGGSSTTPAIRIRSGGNSWSEGLAVHPSANNGFALTFFRTTSDLATSTNTWAIGNLGTNSTNNFGLLRNGLTGSAGIRADAIFDATQAGTLRFGFTPMVGSNTIWHAGNDGSGSGLDADLLDGINSSGFLRSDTSNTMTGTLSLHGNLLLTGPVTTTDQGRLIDFTGFDKEGTTDFSDRAYIQHTINTGGHSGSVLVISSQNDANDGIAFQTNTSSQLRHNGNVVWDAANDGAGSGLDADLLDGLNSSSFLRSDAAGTASGEILFASARTDFGSNGDWNSVGFSNLTNLHVRDHNHFWFGAGNGTWFTGTANTKSQASGLAADVGSAHDLLITTMYSDVNYDRGITFAVESTGAGNSGWRLGKWHSGDARDSSKFVVDGQIFAKAGYTDEYDYYADDYSAYYSSQGGNAHWGGDSGYGWHVPGIVSSSAIQIQSGNAGTNARKPQLQFHQYGYGGPAIEYDGPNTTLNIIGPASRLSSTGFKQQGNTIWHAGNDGGGSGLDADLWDGNQFSSYLNQSVKTDASPTFNNVYTNNTGRYGVGDDVYIMDCGSANTFRVTGQQNNDRGYIAFGNDNTQLGRIGTGALTWGGNTVWHAGNDGAGSGLDADSLDGLTWDSSGKNLRGTEIYADNWFRNYNSGEGLYNEATAMHWYSDTNDRWRLYSTQASASILFTTNGNTARGYLYADTASSIGFLNTGGQWGLRYLSNDGNSPNLYFREEANETWTGNPGNDEGKIEYHSNRFYIAAGANSTEVVRFRRSGTDVARVNNDGSIYAPRYYDWNDGNYYADPASTSIFNTLNVNFLEFNGRRVWDTANTSQNGTLNLGYLLTGAVGNKLYTDEDFNSGTNSINLYNNAGGTAISFSRIADATAPNSSRQILRFVYNGGSNGTSPGFGGFYFATGTSANRTLVCRFKAKLKAGSQFDYHSNAIGTNGTQFWVTSQSGTGRWEEYVSVVMCGDSGTFSSTHFYAVSGGSFAAAETLFDLASASVYDLTNNTSTFTGSLNGNATTATTLQTARLINGTSFNGSGNITTANWGTARTITIGSTGKSVNGSGNVSWSLAEIGALGATAKAADSNLLDGIDSASFLRSDAADSWSGTLSWGASDTHGLSFQNSSYTGNYLYIGGWTSANSNGISRIRNSNANLHLDSGADGNLYLNHYSGGTVYARGSTVWHAGNDGSGSGLDADTVDGIQGGNFLRVDTNDDASGSYLFNRNNPAIVNSSYAQGNNHIELRTTNASNPVLGFHRSGYTATALYHSGYGINSLRMRNADGNDGPIFSTFNDGAGSGLDADLIDGVDSSQIIYGTNSNGTTNADPSIALKSGFYDVYQTNAPSGTWYSYINIRHNNTVNNYGHQIAGSFYSTGDIYNRNINNGGYGSWTKIWNASNDGSGSGLDADLLDGLNSTQYLQTGSNNSTSGTLTITSGSSYPLDINGSNDAKIVLQGSQNPYIRFRSGTLDRAYLQYSAPIGSILLINELGNFGLRISQGSVYTYDGTNSLNVWSAGNDGSGSGLDADTLDGVDSSQFLRSDAADQKTSGILRFNDNVILSLGTGDDAEFFCNGTHFYLDLNAGIGNFYIRDGTVTRFTFDDAGDFTATGNVTAYSDINLKENIEVIPNALDKVEQLRGITYNRNDMEGAPRHAGVIAQEVEVVLPEVVQTNEEGIKSVAYGNMVGLLIEAIKEQQRMIEDLRKEVDSLKKSV